jgi:hypothetical protein
MFIARRMFNEYQAPAGRHETASGRREQIAVMLPVLAAVAWSCLHKSFLIVWTLAILSGPIPPLLTHLDITDGQLQVLWLAIIPPYWLALGAGAGLIGWKGLRCYAPTGTLGGAGVANMVHYALIDNQLQCVQDFRLYTGYFSWIMDSMIESPRFLEQIEQRLGWICWWTGKAVGWGSSSNMAMRQG